jgi:2-polyprenyl-3-methyl-5-hydroxy-6-metoxy-1,4-benzoquinol methylase
VSAPPGPGGDIYTHGHHEAVLRSHRWRTVDNSASYLLPHLRPGLSLLDVGCGPGTLTVDLARRVAPGPVVGVDTAPEVVDAARAHAAEAGAAEVVFVAGDFRTVALPRRRFDVVHAHQVLQHVSDPVGALTAMAGLTAPGGVVAARDSDYPAMTWTPASPALDRWRAVYLAVTARNGANADAGRRLGAWAAAAGLKHIVATTSTWRFERPADVAWWADLWAERTASSTLAEQAVAHGLARPAELEDIARGWRAWARQPGATFVVPHGEILVRP